MAIDELQETPFSSTKGRKRKRVGKCRLCGQVTNLRKSHVVSNFLYRASGQGVFFHIEHGVGRLSSKSIIDWLLCSECEQYVADRGERPIGKLIYRTGKESDTSICQLVYYLGFHEKDTVHVQVKSKAASELTYFALLTLWRSSISSRPAVCDVNLGPYEEHLRLFLRGEVSLHQNIQVQLTVVNPAEDGFSTLASITGVPHLSSRHHGQRVYAFIARGMVFRIFIGHVSLPVSQFDLSRNSGRYVLSVQSRDDGIMRSLLSTLENCEDRSPLASVDDD